MRSSQNIKKQIFASTAIPEQTNHQKSLNLIKLSENFILEGIQKGQIKISNHPSMPKLKKKQKEKNENEQSHHLSINQIDQNLQMIRESIIERKRVEAQEQIKKKKEALSLIKRMQREKAEHKRKLNEQSEKSLLYHRAFSQSAITRLKERIQQKQKTKRQNLSQKIKQIQKRHLQREKQQLNNEVSYWSQVQKIQNKLKRKDNTSLPFISQKKGGLFISQNPQDEKIQITRKNAFSNRESSKKSLRYQQVVGQYLQKAKEKQKQSMLDPLQIKSYSRIRKIIISNGLLAERIKQREQNRQLSINLGLQLIGSSKKMKFLGDEYLKESLLKVKKNDNQTNGEQILHRD